MLATIQAWGADGPLPAVSESQSRIGNAKGSLIKGTLITTYDATKQEQDWYAVTLAQPSPVGWVVFTHGKWWQNGGWFDASKGKPQVQVQAVKDGPWKTVGELSDYPATTATDNKSFPNFTRFACTLTTPVTALSVRVIGRAASGGAYSGTRIDLPAGGIHAKKRPVQRIGRFTGWRRLQNSPEQG